MKWLFSCCKSKKVAEPLVTRSKLVIPRDIPYDLQTMASANMANLHVAQVKQNGNLIEVIVRRKTRVFAYMDEAELKEAIPTNTTVMHLAAFQPDEFWNLALICHCKIGSMERWVLNQK